MSRIVGEMFATTRTKNHLDSALAAVANYQSDVSPVTTKVLDSGQVQLGWTGWQTQVFGQKDQAVVLLDGHIYNDAELCESTKEYRAPHYLIDLYHQRGFPMMLEALNGDFVLIIIDEASGNCYISRDRFGVKPLYYFEAPSRITFASRCASLARLGIELIPDPEYIGRFAGSHYRYIDNYPTRSPYTAIKQLPAGHCMRLRIDRYGNPEIFETAKWWSLDPTQLYSGTPIDKFSLAEQYRALLCESVTLRLRKAHLPVFTLSGGMDSSSVLACAVRQTGRKHDAISSVYVDQTYDERSEIQSMLAPCVENWKAQVIGTPDIFKLIRKMIDSHDEPVATATWLSHYLLCESAANQGYRSLFGGLGGDELNAGEYEHYFYYFADLKLSGQHDLLNSEIAAWERLHDHPIYKKNREIAEHEITERVDIARPGHCLPDKRRLFRYLDAINQEYFSESYTPTMDHPYKTYLANRNFQDLYFETVPCCLRAEDRQANIFGMDNFLPFLDYRVAEFMFRMPGSLKIEHGLSKVLLREAMREILPEETRTRAKKTGWNAPAHNWFSGSGLEQVRDLVSSKVFRDRNIYVLPRLEQLFKDHQDIVTSGAARENHMMFIWQLTNLELWLRSIPEIKKV